MAGFNKKKKNTKTKKDSQPIEKDSLDIPHHWCD